MSHFAQNRRNRRSLQAVMSAMTETVEPRMLLSAASASATKELEIVSEVWSRGERPQIDEIRLVGDEIQVLSTLKNPDRYPGDIILLEGNTQIPVVPDFVTPVRSEPVLVTVPDRDLSIVYSFAYRNQPRSELYYLRTFGTSSLLYRRADADLDSAWPLTDIDPATGSTIGLDFTAKPATPQGFVAVSGADSSLPVTLYFDENPPTAAAGQRYVRRYEVVLQSFQLGWNSSTLTVFDNSRVTWTDANGVSRTFGGSRTLTLAPDVHSFSVRVQQLPVFPDGATGDNALATPWSDWSESTRFAVLPKGQQILIGSAGADYATGVATINWGPVEVGAHYEVWIDRLSDGMQLLHTKGLSGDEFRTEPLDPGDYRVWVRATHADGSRTPWSKSRDFTVYQPYAYFNSYEPFLGPTPTFQWNEISRSTQYRISLTDVSQLAPSNSGDPSPLGFKPAKPVYSRTVLGSSSSHTIDTPLPAGIYRIDLVLYFANGAPMQISSNITILPVGVPLPVSSGDGVQWYAEENAVSYDVWVAYLGSGPPEPGVAAQASHWRFALEDGVVGGAYRLPSSAPGGNYRIWLRPNVQSGDGLVKGTWNASTDIQIAAPLKRPLNIRVESETLTWDAVPGASSYRVTLGAVPPGEEWNYWFWYSRNKRFDVVDTTFRIPDELNDGTYQVWVQALGPGDPINAIIPVPIRIEHGTSPWTWKISNTADAIHWNSVPDAVSYEFRLIVGSSGQVILAVTDIRENTVGLPANLPLGYYGVQIRALRSVNGRQFLTEWAPSSFAQGTVAPSGLRLDGSVLSWDAQANARYHVSISVINVFLDFPPPA